MLNKHIKFDDTDTNDTDDSIDVTSANNDTTKDTSANIDSIDVTSAKNDTLTNAQVEPLSIKI